MAENTRKFDQLEQVIRDLRRRIDDLESTVLTRLATHTHDHGALLGLADDDHSAYSDAGHTHDHGTLTGLGDDDHSAYADVGHTH